MTLIKELKELMENKFYLNEKSWFFNFVVVGRGRKKFKLQQFPKIQN